MFGFPPGIADETAWPLSVADEGIHLHQRRLEAGSEGSHRLLLIDQSAVFLAEDDFYALRR